MARKENESFASKGSKIFIVLFIYRFPDDLDLIVVKFHHRRNKAIHCSSVCFIRELVLNNHRLVIDPLHKLLRDF